MRRRRALITLAVLLVPSAWAVLGLAQEIVRTPFGIDPLGRFPEASVATGPELPSGYDGRFQFCRLRFRNSFEGDGSGWFVDYPRADRNFSARMAELTRIDIPVDHRGRPRHRVVTATDPGLFACPFLVMTEPGGAHFDDLEVERLRTYLLKGGLLWTDDSWGSHAWRWWLDQLERALPRHEYPVVELPIAHPIFHMMFDIPEVPQVPNVGLWVTRGLTAERGGDSPTTPPQAILEPGTDRVMVFMTHNTDFGDAAEEEALSPDYFRQFSVQAYALATNVVLYALTH
ncbi:MAG: DUF4159 domain-containing protein [Acidimicrobiia bacterium]|nr:DUF4159 domain-containing protein [Acidimicrobiia bacterium]